VSEASRAATPVSERIVEGTCLGFALWTLCSHAVIALGGSLGGLLGLFALATGVALVAGRRLGRDADEHAGVDTSAAPSTPAGGARQGLWLAACASAALAAPFAGPLVLWALLLIVLGAAAWLWLLPQEPLAPPAAAASPALEWGLFALAAACVLYALCVHRPDADDSFYVNVAVAAVDHPELPLLARDTLHGRFDLPIHFPVYRLHSFELVIGAVTWITGIPAIRVFHFGATAIGAFLVPLAYAALFRRLVPKHWLWASVAVVVVLAAPGETHRWYGNFAFVRMWQGKAFFLFVFMPLIWLAGLRFALRPDRRRFAMLAATQIAALGCSSTALWAAPVASLVALASALRPNVAGLRTLGVGALASAYLILAGLLVKSGMTASFPELAERVGPGNHFQDVLNAAFGTDRLRLFGIGSLFVAWAAAPLGSLAQRFAVAVPLAVTLVLFNPFIDAWVRAHVTGPTYWRTAWALPAPLLMALVLIAPLRLADRLGSRGAQTATVVALAVFALGIPRTAGFSEQNQAWLGVSRPRLPVGRAGVSEAAARARRRARLSRSPCHDPVRRWGRLPPARRRDLRARPRPLRCAGGLPAQRPEHRSRPRHPAPSRIQQADSRHRDGDLGAFAAAPRGELAAKLLARCGSSSVPAPSRSRKTMAPRASSMTCVRRSRAKQR
jgi:hypothetical protein